MGLKTISKTIDAVFCKLSRDDRDQLFRKILEVASDYEVVLLQQQAKRDDKAKAVLEKLQKQRSEAAKSERHQKATEAIDAQIVLRIFLEYYLREKKVRAFILKKLFEEQPRLGTNSKAGISFQSFKKVIEQFDPDALDIDIATMYRDAWTAGIGVVNFDSFFLVANERTFFLKSIRCMQFNMPPQMNSYEEFDLESKYN